MESPFTEMPVSTGKPYNQWNNNEDEIMMKNPLLDPGQTESLEHEFSFESISREVDEYFSNETNKTGGHFDEYRNESSVHNDLTSYETDFFNETEIEYDVPTIPATVPVASPSCDISIAVTPFEISQAQKIDPDLLSPLKNKKAIEWNTVFLSKIKIDPKNVLTDLQRYVDIAFVKNAIDAYNKSHSSAMIDAGTFPINAIFVEAVHQFQKKIYFDASSIDGKTGPGTLHSLGIISFPQDPKKLAANNSAKEELKNLKIKVLINGTECNYSNWFSFTYNPSFLGKSFNRPVHYLLIKQLRIAESYLLNSARFKGDNLVEMGSKLGLSKDTEEHAGGRFSGGGMHTFGLALDINHNNNPWIGAGWVTKPKKEIYDKLSEPKRKRLDTVLNEKYKILEDLKKASGQKLYGDKISVYLDHVGQTKGADTNDAYKELKQRNDEFIAYLKANPSEWSYWKKSATFEHGYAINGFLNLDQELVYALRQIGNLGWGAIDFGPGEGADGDMMHFDMRTLPIGRKINLCKSSAGGDSLKTHPYLKGAIDKKAVCTTTEKEDYDFNNEDYESWNEPESIDFEDEIENYLNDESDFEVDSYKITDEFDEAYEGEIEEAYEGRSDEEIAEETEMNFGEINYNEELDQEPESDSHGVELEEEDIPQSTEVAISNEYVVDEKKGVTGYLNVSAIKNQPLRTGVFIPAGFTQNNSVDVILYLHGLFDYGSYKYGMAYYWKNYSNIREHFYLSNRNAILIAPALGSNPQITDLIFKYQKGLDQFLSDCIKELIARNYLPAGATPGKIILAAHSAGGYPMSVILRTENSLASNIVECWCFDCFYNYQWEKVLEKNSGKPFYHYWAYTYNGKMSGPGSRGEVLAKTYPNLKNIKPAAGIHHREVIEYAWKNEINKRSWFTPISVTSSTVNQEVNEWDGESADTKYNNLNQNKNTDYLTYDQFTNEERWNEMYENESNEASLMEGLLPAVSMNDIRTRLDDYLDQANAEYTLEDGTTIRARHTFAYGYGVTPVLDTLKRKIQTQLGSSIYNKLQQKSNPIITKALYGRAKPSELKLITQALIKSSSDIFADADDIRAHQREFRIGIDCAGYVQLAFFYSLYGHDNDTPARRKAVGLEETRGSERLENLGTANFTEVGILKAQPGDLMVMNPRQKSETDHSYLDSDHSMHTVIVVDHSKKGDVHEYLLDASWGNDAYGAKYGGVGRRTLCYDEVSKEWWDIHPGSGAKISGYKFVKAGSGWAIVGAQPGDPGFHSTAKIGPYLGHKIKGVYRPKLKAAPVKEISEANDFELMDESEFDSIHEESVPWNEAGSFHLMNPFRNQEEIENEFESGNTFIDTVTKVTYGAVNIMQVITNLMKEGSDENTITDAILFIRHPELKNKKLTPNSSQVLKIEWLKIRDELVRPQLKKLKSQYQAQSVSDSKKQKDLASAIADFGKYRNFKDNILVWDLNGEGIFFEFEDGRLKYELSYPNEKNRIYYKQGDVILVNKVQADKLPSYFNSQSPDDSDDSISYLTVLLAFLNEGEQTEYELGYRVIHIFSYGKNSEVELKPLIKLENTWFEAEENINIPAYAYTGTLKDGSLSSRFWMARTSEHFHDVARILLIEAKVTKTLLSLYGSEVGEIVIKKILRWGAKKTIGAGIKKAIKYYFAQFVKGIPFIFLKGIKAFVLIIAKEILVMKIERNRLAQFQYYVKSEDFKPVIIRASEAMAVAMVNQLFEILVGDRVNRFFLNLLKSAKSSPDRLKSMLTGFLSKKIISLFTKDFANEIIGAVTEAYEESLQQKESFEELLLKKISQKVQEDFIDRLKSWTFEAVEDVSKGVIEIFER